MTLGIERNQTHPCRERATLRLPGGEHVIVRCVRPQDELKFQNFVRGLSNESRYWRFMTGSAELPQQILTSLIAVDARAHLALVAETPVDGSEAIVGEGRYVVSAGSNIGEFALAVSDAWQRRGIGSMLIASLLRDARSAGLSGLYGDVLRDNQRTIKLARRVGFSLRTHPEDARLVRLEVKT